MDQNVTKGMLRSLGRGVKWFRAPHGKLSANMAQVLKEEALVLFLDSLPSYHT